MARKKKKVGDAGDASDASGPASSASQSFGVVPAPEPLPDLRGGSGMVLSSPDTGYVTAQQLRAENDALRAQNAALKTRLQACQKNACFSPFFNAWC